MSKKSPKKVPAPTPADFTPIPPPPPLIGQLRDQIEEHHTWLISALDGFEEQLVQINDQLVQRLKG
jgi:hypothetical protein